MGRNFEEGTKLSRLNTVQNFSMIKQIATFLAPIIRLSIFKYVFSIIATLKFKLVTHNLKIIQMKKTFTILGKGMALLMLVSLIFSCKTNENVVNNSFIQKRKYNKGYHLSLKKNKYKIQKVKNEELAEKKSIEKSEKLIPISGITSKIPSFKKENSIDNSLVASKYIIPKREVSTEEKNIEAEELIKLVSSKIGEKKTQRLIKKANKKLEKKNMPPLSGGKSQIIALVLALLVGGLAIHRFYLGYVWQGIVQILTAGGCGIWWLIDVIRIVTGDLKPKDGSYDQTL